MKELVLNYLKLEVRFRERKNKNKGIANVLVKKYGLLTPENAEDFIADILTADRVWRQLLSEHKELRGSDYEDKDQLEKEKQLELGYNIPTK